MKAFKNVLVYTEDKGIVRSDIQFDDRIRVIGKSDCCADVIPLPESAIVLPGFIDGHVHGAGGADVMDGTVDALKVISEALAKEGTTGFLATTMTQSSEQTVKALTAVNDFCRADFSSGARILGVHLEGPFISPEYKGAQPQNYIVKPDVKLFENFYKASGNSIKTVTLAPETDGAEKLLKYLYSKHITGSIGHTAATESDMRKAVLLGASAVTHMFNAMSVVGHRNVGAAGFSLVCDELNCELIGDMIHVCPAAVKLLVRCKPHDKITLVTDSVRAKGLRDGESELGGQSIYIKDGAARLAGGTLAGSILKMNEAIKNMVEQAGVTLEEAVDFASANPAKKLGIYNDCGSIRCGKKANFAVLDSEYNVLMTVLSGEIIYTK